MLAAAHFQAASDVVNVVAVSDDGSRVATASASQMRLYSVGIRDY
jgi:hypothetical protein